MLVKGLVMANARSHAGLERNAGGASRARWWSIAGLVMGVAACGATALAGGGDPTLDDAWLNARVAQLDDADFVVRERATDEMYDITTRWSDEAKVRLAADPLLTDDQREQRAREIVLERSRQWLAAIEGKLAIEATLSGEQRERLTQVGIRLFGQMPHGAMGVSFSRADRGQGVEISGVVAGFDSMRVLQPGDVVLQIDGRDVNAQTDMRAAIISHDPGDEVDMTLLRRGERVVVSLKLGDFDTLRNALAPDRGLIRDALEMRIARRAGQDIKSPEVIEPGIDSARWAKLQVEQNERAAVQMRAPRNIDANDDGEGGAAPALMSGGADRPANGGDVAFAANPTVLDERAIAELNRDRAMLNQQYREALRQLSLKPDPAQRLMLSNSMRVLQSQIEDIDRKLQQMGMNRPNVPGRAPNIRRRNPVRP